MAWEEAIIRSLKAHNVGIIAYVPDAVVWKVLSKIEDDMYFQMVPATREEEAIGILSGAYAAGKRGAIFMQSSGFGNCINALGSLCVPLRIPMPMFISMRGEVGEFNINQVAVGRALRPTLDALGLQHVTLAREDEVEATMQGTLKLCYAGRVPVGILLSTLLTGGKDG